MNDSIINKLSNNLVTDIDIKYKLSFKDIIRLASYLDGDPFSETECCKWKGSISISTHKSRYINFWYKKKKHSLHRLLYINYKNSLPDNKYLRFSCDNYKMRGICCNINHIDIINNNNIYNKSINIDTIFNNNNHDIFVIVFND